MPVQFLSGGGGTSDVRESFAAPVLNTCSFLYAGATQNLVKWTIPANYLQVNDTLCCSIFLDMTESLLPTNSAQRVSRAYFRLGTTGSNTDSLVGQIDNTLSGPGEVNPPTFFKGIINVKSTGSSGTCIGNLMSLMSNGRLGSTQTATGIQTINTSSVLYLTLWLSYSPPTSSYYATLSPVGSSICVSF